MNSHPELSKSDFNLQKVNTDQLAAHLEHSIHANSSVFIVGKRGLGKTAVSKQAISASGLKEIYLNLSILERTDFAGYPKLLGYVPNVDDKEQFVKYILPQFFEPLIYGEQKCVLLLDEADKATNDLLAPLLEVLQFHTINGRSLPNLASCILTGNLISEGSARPHLTILDRVEKFLLETTADVWLKWAATPDAKIHTSIFQFIQDQPHRLCGAVDIGESYAAESPRSWHLASKMVHFAEQHKWSNELILEKIGAFVGKQVGIEYMSYYMHYQKLLPLCNDIMAGKPSKDAYNSLPTSEKIVVSMIVAARFASELDKHNPTTDKPDCLKHVAAFMQYAGQENVVAALRAQVQLERVQAWGLIKNEYWKEIIRAINSHVIVNIDNKPKEKK